MQLVESLVDGNGLGGAQRILELRHKIKARDLNHPVHLERHAIEHLPPARQQPFRFAQLENREVGERPEINRLPALGGGRDNGRDEESNQRSERA